MAITKDNIKEIHADIRAALEAVAKKHNLSIAKTHITYYEASFKFAAEFGSKDVLGDTNPIYYNDLKKHGWLYSLTTDDVGLKIKIGAREYTLEGMKSKNWVIGKNAADGKFYKLRPADVCAVTGRDNKMALCI